MSIFGQFFTELFFTKKELWPLPLNRRGQHFVTGLNPSLAPFFNCLPQNENFGPLESKPLLEIINWSNPSRGPVGRSEMLSKEIDKEVKKVGVVMDEVVDK